MEEPEALVHIHELDQENHSTLVPVKLPQIKSSSM